MAEALLGYNAQPQTMGRVPLASMIAPDQQPALSSADALQQTGRSLGDWIQNQRDQSAQMGLWNDQTGLPTQAGISDAAKQMAMNMQSGIRAYHGSPYNFDQFDLSKIGSGEGAQAYGHGLYFAGNESVARGYRDALTAPTPNPDFVALQRAYNAADAASSRAMAGGSDAEFNAAIAARDAVRAKLNGVPALLPNQSGGHMYEVNLGVEPNQLLDWHAPLRDQTAVMRNLSKAGVNLSDKLSWTGGGPPSLQPFNPTGGQFYESSRLVQGDYRDPAAATHALQQMGIPGIKYFDAGSRGAGEGTSNYVMFDPARIEIMRKYGMLGLLGGGAAAGIPGNSEQ